MQFKPLKIMAVTCMAALVMLATGCGGDDDAENKAPSPEEMVAAQSHEDFNQRLEELKKAELTVEVIQSGESEGKWSQNGRGSWRWDSAVEGDSYMIFNSDQKKFWTVTGNTAVEQAQEQSAAYESFNPALMMSAFTAVTFAPRTGGSEDVWEWEIAGLSKLIIEFKGPDGMISKVIDEDIASGESDFTEFRYSNVGSVPDDLFELPSDVEVESIGSNGVGTSTSMDDLDVSGLTGSGSEVNDALSSAAEDMSNAADELSGSGLYGGDTP